MIKKLITNISELFTAISESNFLPIKNYTKFKVFKDVHLEIIEDKFGKIIPQNQKIDLSQYQEIIDANNNAVIPGLVDSHTHAVFPAYREKEFAMRMEGKTYLEILEEGGGILNSAQKTAQISEEELLDKTLERLDIMAEYGTTTVEIKSGYGLNLEDELKILRVIKKASQFSPLDIVPTFMGAHAIPQKYKNDRKGYISLVKKMIDIVTEEKLAIFNDVFCEKGAFTPEEALEILEYGLQKGLIPKIHADEIESIGGIDVACQINAISAEHLLATKEDDMKKMAKAGIIANLLPITALFLRKKAAPARKFIENQCPIAISTDCNPGSSMSESMQLAISLGCLTMNLTIEESLIASTYNGACALKKGNILGAIEEGKQADCIILKGSSYFILPYHFGVNNSKMAIKKGKIIKRLP